VALGVLFGLVAMKWLLLGGTWYVHYLLTREHKNDKRTLNRSMEKMVFYGLMGRR